MVYGGIIAILIAIWIYRTAIEAKTGNLLFWVAGSFIVFLAIQITMIRLNVFMMETFDGDVSAKFDSIGAQNADSTGLKSRPSGFIGFIFEMLQYIVPFFVVAVLRLKLMLKQPFSFSGLFSGIKEMFIGIKNSFTTTE